MITAGTIDGTNVVNRREFTLTDITSSLFSSPAARENSQTRPDQDGSFELTRYYEARVFELAGRIPVQSGDAATGWQNFLDARDLLGTLLQTGIDHQFVVTYPDGTQKQISFRVIGELTVDNSGYAPAARWHVQCRAADPRWYGTTTRSVTFDPSGSPVTGITVPLVTPLDPEAGASGSSISLLNAGNYWTTPTHTVTGPWVNPWAWNQTTDVYFYTRDLNLGAADVMVIDTAHQQILINGERRDDVADWSASDDWPYMSSGSNLFTAGGAYSTGASWVITAQDAWI